MIGRLITQHYDIVIHFYFECTHFQNIRQGYRLSDFLIILFLEILSFEFRPESRVEFI